MNKSKDWDLNCNVAGSFGVVHKISRLGRGAIAVKRIRSFASLHGKTNILNGTDLTDGEEAIFHEVEILSYLQHTHIIKYITHCTSKVSGEVLLAMEFCSLGDLDAYISSTASICVSVTQSIVQQLMTGLAYLHSQQVVHRDLKPANILLSGSSMRCGEFTVKLGDFGVSVCGFLPMHEQPILMCGTLPFLAPEAINSNTETNRVDIWAAGVVMYELLTGRLPFSRCPLRELLKTGICDEGYAEPEGISRSCSDLLKQLLCFVSVSSLMLTKFVLSLATERGRPHFCLASPATRVHARRGGARKDHRAASGLGRLHRRAQCAV